MKRIVTEGRYVRPKGETATLNMEETAFPDGTKFFGEILFSFFRKKAILKRRVVH